MARIAGDVHTCCFDSKKEIESRVCKGNWSPVDIPLFLPARKDSDGNVKPLFESVQDLDENLARTDRVRGQ